MTDARSRCQSMGDLQQFRNLPAAEKLRIIEQLWDDLAASGEPIALQDWHRTEAQKRAAELEAQPDIALTREELWNSISSTPDDVPVHDWQLDELEERAANLRKDPAAGLSWEEVKQRIRGRYGRR